MAMSPRQPISREALLGQFLEDVSLLAASASEQEQWLTQSRYPVVELALQYYDSFHTFGQRLAENGLLDAEDCLHLEALETFMVGLPPYPDDFAWLRTADEWAEIRRLAHLGLASLQPHAM